MVTMPAGHANAGAGPSKPVFYQDLGVDGMILPPPDTSKSEQSAKSAAETPVGAGTVGKSSTASVGKRFSFTEKRSAGDVLQRHYANAGSNLSAYWLPDYTEQSPRAQAQAKRQRSQEAPRSGAKKSRVQSGRSFGQIAKEGILIRVLVKAMRTEESHGTSGMAKIEKMPGPTSQAVMILNKESLAPIDTAGGELICGFSSVFIRVYKLDATPTNGLSDKPAEEDIAEELEAPGHPELDGYVSRTKCPVHYG
ncbi:hypothetical protein ACLKA7_001463 [Drosophila subpalustris]